MKNRVLIAFLGLLVVALFAFSCKKSENAYTDTSSTTTSATDTSATTSTTDTANTATTASAAPLNDKDKETVTKIAQANQAEIDASTLAATKATNADVKSFANRMVTDHGKAGDELKNLVANKSVTLPAQTDDDHKKAIDKLSKADAKKFDKEYMEAMVKDHEKAVADFEKTSKDAADPDLKSWASKTLPTIQDHLKMAKEIEGKLK